ncbi:MAG: tRNA pseudouridine synthase [Deltaproteobacteria bacterium]|nr:tRNA pseudouridine synthase [Deltaproteobacteria bacterium]
MRNIKLTIEYDGTNYHGWQYQPNARTIQGVMEELVGRIVNEKVTLAASGRTDAGVHALNQVANFRTSRVISCESLQRGLNALLPQDIAVKDVSEADDDFHSRFSATGKVYIYQILNRPHPSALLNRFSWFIRYPLNVEMMNEAATHIIGKHDFSSFRASSCGAPHPVKDVKAAQFRREGDLLVFEIEATGFLHHMVRNIVGTLIDVGMGRRATGSFKELLDLKDRRLAGVTAPPHGLFLKDVKY